ncbi:MAG: DUF1963 domain-containing protein [Planctomycetota bacterium]|nr:DUF1963 domain-containing protein [Planctomycetota bacterium]
MAKKKPVSVERPTLESILDQIETLDSRTETLELSVPRRLTHLGRLVCGCYPLAVVIDRMLQKGFEPVGGEAEEDGKRLNFQRTTKKRSSAVRTAAPPIDVIQRVPALARFAKTTIRLHPRRERVADPAASKLGGQFLWPRSEPWPRCDDHRHQTGVDGRESPTGGVSPILVGAIQLNARDFPTLPFKPGCDLLQLLWCPTTEDAHDDAFEYSKVFTYWRNSQEIVDPLPAAPLPDFGETIRNHFPISCGFHSEEVREFPGQEILQKLARTKGLRKALSSDKVLRERYEGDLSACPSMKLGGYPYWVQNDDTPQCVCGATMEFLLQLGDWEYTNIDSSQRWIPRSHRWTVKEWRTNPVADGLLRPPLFDFGHLVYYFFICRKCPDRPVRFVTQS